MLSLGIELIVVLLLMAVVGLLMGRFLCKSGESDEKEQKKKVIHAFQTSQSELEISRERVKEQSLNMTELEDTIARREQHIRNMETKLLSSDKHRVKLLEELKTLEKYKARFESLTEEFDVQKSELEILKSDKIENQKKIDGFKISTNRLNKTIFNSKSSEVELESEIEKLDQTVNRQKEAYRESTSKREKKYEELIQESHKKHQEKLNSKDNAYDKLQHQKEKAYREMLESKEEAYETLEKSRTKIYQNMLESKNELYQELREELESVESEYEEFKINYNLDSDRLNTIEEENQKIYNTLDTIAHERDDLLARLRAISSVVGAVGIENISEPPKLLQN